MPTKSIKMKPGNKGLTVKVNLWSLDKYKGDLDAGDARLWLKGQVTHADTRESKKFNDAGELVTFLGKWNVAKLKELKRSR